MLDIIVISHACFTAINRSVYQLFLKDGWKIELVVPKELQFPSGKRKADPPETNDPEIHYVSLKGTNPRIYDFEGLITLLNTKKPRIILLDNDPVSRMALLLGKWSRGHDAWLFCISNENFSLDIGSTIKRKGWGALPAALVKRSLLLRTKKLVDGIFTINADGQRIFTEEGYQNVIHMPLGFDPEYFFPDDAGRWQIRDKYKLNKTVVAYFGRLTLEKGIHILITALQKLKQYDWQLMMDSFDVFASDYNREVDNMLKEAGMMDRVIFIKPNHFEIAAYINAADIVVVPSVTVSGWKEQYGRVAAEAMACGKQVIASNSGALPELLSGYGQLFEEGNDHALKELLEPMLDGKVHPGQYSGEEIAVYALDALSIYRQKTVMEKAFQ